MDEAADALPGKLCEAAGSSLSPGRTKLRRAYALQPHSLLVPVAVLVPSQPTSDMQGERVAVVNRLHIAPNLILTYLPFHHDLLDALNPEGLSYPPKLAARCSYQGGMTLGPRRAGGAAPSRPSRQILHHSKRTAIPPKWSAVPVGLRCCAQGGATENDVPRRSVGWLLASWLQRQAPSWLFFRAAGLAAARTLRWRRAGSPEFRQPAAQREAGPSGSGC